MRLADNLRVKSKVHPKYKTKYHGGNWPEYEQALVRRGDVTLWLSAEAMDAWRPAPSGRPGGPRKFSDVSIMTALMLRLVFRLPLRQTEGFLRSVLALMRTDLKAPDHTMLSRRSQHLDLALDRIPAQRPVHLIVDSTGLSIVGAWLRKSARDQGRTVSWPAAMKCVRHRGNVTFARAGTWAPDKEIQAENEAPPICHRLSRR